MNARQILVTMEEIALMKWILTTVRVLKGSTAQIVKTVSSGDGPIRVCVFGIS